MLAVNDEKSIQRYDHDEYTKDQIELIKRTICKGASDDELMLFMAQAKKSKLDPFSRQIWSIERKSKDGDRWITTRTTQTSIDGLRLIADRTGKYVGQTKPMWCGRDGKWVDVWLENTPPLAAMVGVYRSDFKEPIYAVARLFSYGQKKTGGEYTKFWATMPDLMLSKCAEALALRKAFPQELSGLYTNDELGQIENEDINDKKSYKKMKNVIPIEKWIEIIKSSKTLSSLKNEYSKAYKIAMENKDSSFMAEITEEKDKRKKEIEAESKKISTEFFGEDSDMAEKEIESSSKDNRGYEYDQDQGYNRIRE